MEKDGWTIKKCVVCGKKFCPPFPALWAYKRDFRWYCSYGCMRQKTAKKRRTGPNPGNSYAVLAVDACTDEVVRERAPKRDRKYENPVAKRVEMVDPDTGRVVAEYRSLAECERACKISDKTLRAKIQRCVIYNGFLFRLKDAEE